MNGPLLLIKGMISELPADDQKKVFECADRLRAIVAEGGDACLLALALITTEEKDKN